METEFINKDNIDIIWKYIKANNTEIAKIFYLHFISEMTLKEIAQELEKSESTIKSSLYRMLKRLKNNFGGEKFEK